MSRKASHAGSWYPSSSTTLASNITTYLSSPSSNRTPKALVLPHAGYSYSGPTAGVGYALVSDVYKRVFVVGPSHCEAFRGARTTGFESYDTPVGSMAVDKQGIYSSSLFFVSICFIDESF